MPNYLVGYFGFEEHESIVADNPAKAAQQFAASQDEDSEGWDLMEVEVIEQKPHGKIYAFNVAKKVSVSWDITELEVDE